LDGGHEKAAGGQYFDEKQLENICNSYIEKIVDLGI
jgi:hypothetical protein